MSMSMSIVDLYCIAHNREAPNALCTLGHNKNCQQNTSDLEGSLVTSSTMQGNPGLTPTISPTFLTRKFRFEIILNTKIFR